MFQTKLLPLALMALSQTVAAQAISAAGQFQQIPPQPVIPNPAPVVRIEYNASASTAPVSGAVSNEIKVRLSSLHVTGASAYAEAELLALTGFEPGTELSMVDLLRMTASIANRYHQDGYLLAQAYLPAQDIRDGAVTIAVLEGQYGTISVRNPSGLSQRVIERNLTGLHSGDTVTRAPLDHSLLLLSDLPGVVVRSTLVPGALPGTSDLIIDVIPSQTLSGSVEADNAGNPYTGRYRAGASVNWNQPLGIGDVASLRTLTAGKGFQYGRASYQAPLGSVTLGVAYSKIWYELIEQFAPLHAHGTADIASVYASYPLLRTRDSNLYAQLAYDVKSFHDQVDSNGTYGDKRARVVTASLYGDQRDNLGGGGANTVSLAVSSGQLELETASLRAVDALTARSAGHYSKFTYGASRVQHVTDAVSLAASVTGQIASKNLDVSEKMELGGMNAVRAYPEGEAYADQGYVLSAEVRLLLARFSPGQLGQVQLLGFVDTGRIERDQQPWSSADNRRTLSGAGVGVLWSEAGNFMVRAYYAWKVGAGMATSAPDKSGRFWIQAVKYF